MTNVLALFPMRLAPRPPPGLPTCVRWFSRVVSFGFLVAAISFAALVVSVLGAMFLFRGGLVGLGPHGGWFDSSGHMARGYTALGDLSLSEKMTYLLVAVVHEGPKVAILLSQAALFHLYAEGAVFQPANARRLRDTAAWLIVDGVAPVVCHLTLAAMRLEVDQRWAHLGSVQEVVLGFLLFVVAAVMTLGREIEEDSRGFV